MSGDNSERRIQKPGVMEVFFAFLKLGLTSFGGPVAHIGYFRKEFVEKRGWLNESQFSQLFAVCQFLPGPASSQLGFSLGLYRAGWLGAIAAFLAFTMPSVILLICFAAWLPLLNKGLGVAAIHGLKIVAVVVVFDAVVGMFKKLCPDIERKIIAAVATITLVLVQFPFLQIGIVIAGTLAGSLFCKGIQQSESNVDFFYLNSKTGGVLLALFFVLLALFLSMMSAQPSPLSVAGAFYQTGAMVFGGGHVVLPLLEDVIVGAGWLSEDSFLAGYGAAQAIPGPMFAFSAYLGMIIPAGVNSVLLALLALFAMFLPGFLLVGGVLPYWIRLTRNRAAARAVAGVNASVVGILAAALYDPLFTTGISSLVDFGVCLVGVYLLSILRLSPLVVVLWCVISSVVLGFSL